MIIILCLLALTGIILYYFKFKADERKKKAKQTEVDETDCIDINDYPTFTRHKPMKDQV